MKKISAPTVKPIVQQFTEVQEDEDIEEDELEEPIEEMQQVDVPEKPKRGRGRPPKNATKIDKEETTIEKPKRGRGRPPKNAKRETELETTLPGVGEEYEAEEEQESTMLPGMEAEYEAEEEQEETMLPGMEIENEVEEEQESTMLPGMETEDEVEEEQEETMLPGTETEYEADEEQYESILPGIDKNSATNSDNIGNTTRSENGYNNFNKNLLEKREEQEYYPYDYTEYNNLLSSTKKVIAFVGTSKNGTSFIVNNVAKILSDQGIDTAILDTTQNKNAYYIYTSNDENLRTTATSCIENLINGRTEGIQVKDNLTVYTEPPMKESSINRVGPILENLIKRYSAVLIDCDFNTNYEYLNRAQEIYLIQSMDVLTIQPLTAFLRELKSKDIIRNNNIKVVLNKYVKLKGIKPETIVGGMAYYNDPEMSFMTELFDKNSIVPIQIPFDLEVYQNYLQQLVECEISVSKYPTEFQNALNDLASIIYPLLPAHKTKTKKGYPYEAIQQNNSYSNNGFSNSVNNTLNNMKKNINKN